MSDPYTIHNPQAEHLSSASTEREKTSNDGITTTATHPWLRFYEQGVPAQLDIPDQPLTWLLDSAVSHYPGQTAIIYYGTKLSYAQLSSLANRFAAALQKLGIHKGDRVAIALPNIPQYPIAFYGALRAGAVVVPTNPLYTEREMQHQMADSGARVLVMLDNFYPIVHAVRAHTQLEHIILTSPADFLPPVLHALYPLSQRNARHPETRLSVKERLQDKTLHSMSAMLQLQSRNGIEVFNLPVQTSGDELAVLQYTGGTTGLSKRAMLTPRHLLANSMPNRHLTPP